MTSYQDKISDLLNKECFIIDILPETVPANSEGQYFDIEYYLLNGRQRDAINEKFVRVILKLMCYYHVAVNWGTWIDKPDPQMIDEIITEIMNNHSGTLDCIFPNENALLVFDWDCLYMTVYNPPSYMQRVIEQIAHSEGLFWRLGVQE